MFSRYCIPCETEVKISAKVEFFEGNPSFWHFPFVPSLHQGSTASRKTLEQKSIFQIGTLDPYTISTNAFHSTRATNQ